MLYLSGTTDKTLFIIRARRPLDVPLDEKARRRSRAFGQRASSCYSPPSFPPRRMIRVRLDGRRDENRCNSLTHPSPDYMSMRGSVCASNITHNREDRPSDGFAYSRHRSGMRQPSGRGPCDKSTSDSFGRRL